MKKIILLSLLCFVFACTPTGSKEKKITLAETDVRLEFFTTEPNYDEIEFSFYNNATDKFVDQTLIFEYDKDGNPLPLVVNWEDFGYRYVRGEAYRNNFSSAKLTINIYVNDELVYEETRQGNANAYARVTFDHTIKLW